MRRTYLGDSYDAVKRMWQDVLAGWAPLNAERSLIPDDLKKDFTTITRIPMLTDKQTGKYSILNDPDVGIRLPGQENQSESISHITINTIIGQIKNGAQCVVTFDQSNYRNLGIKREAQHAIKLNTLGQRQICSFYYESHAPFLFALSSKEAFLDLLKIFKEEGIPGKRLQHLDSTYNKQSTADKPQ